MPGTAPPATRPDTAPPTLDPAPPSAPTRPDTDIDFDRLRSLRQLRPHNVIVLDCMCHSFDDVERALCRYIPGMTRDRAYAHALAIHTTGASVVATAPRESAEHFAAGLRSRGLRVRVEQDS
jgi:ATP-dependent Clp protease adapter protein ClpS